ncbi:hypothetical protein SHKM778_09420 [Streptomyces sp. KM77-8]|uniref:Uncharacterized protein n=1 Tax=Streptomyces haneummycinicus TaxID=3074435 RepID=A0AAT9HB60_9ACTN
MPGLGSTVLGLTPKVRRTVPFSPTSHTRSLSSAYTTRSPVPDLRGGGGRGGGEVLADARRGAGGWVAQIGRDAHRRLAAEVADRHEGCRSQPHHDRRTAARHRRHPCPALSCYVRTLS